MQGMDAQPAADGERWRAPDLSDRVALVSGASRGAGRAIARVLGEAGATVYATARSSRSRPSAADAPGSVEETAEEVDAAGGKGIPVVCDHRDPDALAALFARVRSERRRLDLLVNNAWGGYADGQVLPVRFWEETARTYWRRMVEDGLRMPFLTTGYALPCLERARRALVVHTSFAMPRDRYTRPLPYYLAKSAVCDMARCMAVDLRAAGIAVVAVSPGFMRTEIVLGAFGVDDSSWRSVPQLAESESPSYVGRCIAALAADAKVMKRSGGTFTSGDLARDYGVTDVDGRWIPPFSLDGRIDVSGDITS